MNKKPPSLPEPELQEPRPNNKRLCQRYPCVGITLMYSPLISKNAPSLAEHLYNATTNDASLSGLSFDITQQLHAGDKLVVLVSIPELQASERLLTHVRWCKELSDHHFRVGVEIDTSEVITKDTPGDHISVPVNSNAVPAEAEMRCPACMQITTFVFIDHQPVPNKGSMPLYNCSNCGSTRSLMGILASNRNYQI